MGARILANWRSLFQCLNNSLNTDMAGTQLGVFVVAASAARISVRSRFLIGNFEYHSVFRESLHTILPSLHR